jgi:tetratricopeptide (TPR) repeat protein
VSPADCRLPVKDEIARDHVSLGHPHLFLGRLDESIKIFQKAVRLTKERFDSQTWGNSSTSIGVAQWVLGDFDSAEKTISSIVNLTKNQYNTRVLYPNICITELLTITGRYYEANEKIDRADSWLNNIKISQWSFHDGRLSRVLWWIALRNDHYEVAQDHTESKNKMLSV